MKRLAVVLSVALIISVFPMASLVSANGGPSQIWGIDPTSADQELVAIDAWTGTQYGAIALPGDPSGDTELALAGDSTQLYYVNGDDDDSTVYVLDPTDGSTLGTLTITGGWDVDGLGYYNEGTGYLYTSGCLALDMHRYLATGGGPTFFWSDAYMPQAVGGDDTGRIFTTHYDGEDYVIVEVDPVNYVPVINTFAAPSQDIVGMAYDDTYLYVSDTNDMLYILDPDDGTILNSLDLGYTLYALAISGLPTDLVNVEKEWSYTNVVFAYDDDGDGLYDEDPVDGINNDGDVDMYGDPIIDEDPIEDYNTVSPLTQLEAKVKNDKIHTINPGQFYAVSTVEVLEDLDTLVITENYDDVIETEIGVLNPVKGGGKVIVVQMIGGMPVQILDANDPEVVVNTTDNYATITLTDVDAGSVYLVYVKFAPGLKGAEWVDTVSAINHNTADATAGALTVSETADATIQVIAP